MNTKKFSILTFALCLLGIPVYANHGVDAIGALVELIIIVALVALILTFVSWAVISRAKKRNNRTLRAVGIVMNLPMLVIALLVLPQFPGIGFIALILFLISCVLVYRSMNYESAENI